MQKKRVMVLGSSGSLGSYLADALQPHHSVICARPRNNDACRLLQHVDWATTPLDICNGAALRQLVTEVRPDVIVNCVAVTPKSREIEGSQLCHEVNADFPHRLADAAKEAGAYLIQISTDGVYSGTKGYYSERDVPDPIDAYGRTKLLGELNQANCVTLRTTFYGVFSTRQGLLNWFLEANESQWKGFSRYVFSPLSARLLASVVETLFLRTDRPQGIFHVGGDSTSKFELLRAFQNVAGLRGDIEPVATPVIDRSLNSTLFWSMVGRNRPCQGEMVESLRPEIERFLSSVSVPRRGPEATACSGASPCEVVQCN